MSTRHVTIETGHMPARYFAMLLMSLLPLLLFRRCFAAAHTLKYAAAMLRLLIFVAVTFR